MTADQAAVPAGKVWITLLPCWRETFCEGIGHVLAEDEDCRVWIMRGERGSEVMHEV